MQSREQGFGEGAGLIDGASKANNCISFVALPSPSIVALTVLLFIAIFTISRRWKLRISSEILWDCEYRFGVVKRTGFCFSTGPVRVFEWKDRERSWTELSLGWPKSLFHEDSLMELVIGRI